MGIEAVINGGLSFAAVLVMMALNIPIGIAMLVVGFVGFALISGFDPAIFVLGTAPFDAVSKYTLSEGENNKVEIKSNNSFLHDNVD